MKKMHALHEKKKRVCLVGSRLYVAYPDEGVRLL
jgi:hypothetical protein